jgi:hypothetical protein
MLILLMLDVTVITVLQQTETNFNDLGRLMLAGLAVALVFAVAFAFVRLRLRDRKPQNSGFISIRSIGDDE